MGYAKKLIKRLCFAFTAVMLAIMFTPLPNLLARPLVVSQAGLEKTGVIAVLGGGAYPNGALGGASNERLLRGLLLYRQGYSDKMVFTGGTVPAVFPKLVHTVLGRGAGETHPESSVMAAIALEIGVPAGDFVIDDGSLNTYENLRFVKAYMEENGVQTVTIVTSPVHMLRSALVAGKLGMRFQSAPVADYTAYRTSAIDRLSLAREAFWEYSALALYRFRGYI